MDCAFPPALVRFPPDGPRPGTTSSLCRSRRLPARIALIDLLVSELNSSRSKNWSVTGNAAIEDSHISSYVNRTIRFPPPLLIDAIPLHTEKQATRPDRTGPDRRSMTASTPDAAGSSHGPAQPSPRCCRQTVSTQHRSCRGSNAPTHSLWWRMERSTALFDDVAESTIDPPGMVVN